MGLVTDDDVERALSKCDYTEPAGTVTMRWALEAVAPLIAARVIEACAAIIVWRVEEMLERGPHGRDGPQTAAVEAARDFGLMNVRAIRREVFGMLGLEQHPPTSPPVTAPTPTEARSNSELEENET